TRPEFFHGFDLVDHFTRIELPDRSANLPHDRRRIAVRAHHHSYSVSHQRHKFFGKLHKRIEELRLDGGFLVGGRSPLFHVADYAHDLELQRWIRRRHQRRSWRGWPQP